MGTKRLFINGNDAHFSVIIADTLISRLVGLLGKRLAPTEGLLLTPCRGVHTIGMRFPIDIVYLDFRNRVLRVLHAVPPYRMPHAMREARSVLELPAGTAQRVGIDVDAFITFSDQ